MAGSMLVNRLRRWPNTNPTLGLLYTLSQHIRKHMYEASSKCGVSKHLIHVRNFKFLETHVGVLKHISINIQMWDIDTPNAYIRP